MTFINASPLSYPLHVILFEFKELVSINGPLDKSKRVYQLWFESKQDIEQFNKNLYVSKLSNTAHETA